MSRKVNPSLPTPSFNSLPTPRTHSQHPKVTHFQHKRRFRRRGRDNFNTYHKNSCVTIHNNTSTWSLFGRVGMDPSTYIITGISHDPATHTDRIQRRTQPKHKSISATHTDSTQPYTQRKLSHTHRPLYVAFNV